MAPILGDRPGSARLYRFVSRLYDVLRPLFAGFRTTRKEYFESLRLGPEDRVLDVGCGTGESTRRLLSERRSVHGLDLTAGQVETAARKSQLESASFAIGDAMTLPYRSDTFDAVTSVGSVQHLPDVGAALSELHRVTKPGGTLFLVGPKRPSGMLTGAVADRLAHFIRPVEITERAIAAGWTRPLIRVVHMRYLARDAVVLTARA